jgi:hypothetical protein
LILTTSTAPLGNTLLATALTGGASLLSTLLERQVTKTSVQVVEELYRFSPDRTA